MKVRNIIKLGVETPIVDNEKCHTYEEFINSKSVKSMFELVYLKNAQKLFVNDSTEGFDFQRITILKRNGKLYVAFSVLSFIEMLKFFLKYFKGKEGRITEVTKTILVNGSDRIYVGFLLNEIEFQTVCSMVNKDHRLVLRYCVNCEVVKEKMKRCSGCRGVHYCSTNCQEQHWDCHKSQCK